MDRRAYTLVLIASAACAAPVRADIYAYVGEGSSVLLTNIAASNRKASWIIGTGGSRPTAVKPMPLKSRDRFREEVLAAAREYAVDRDLIHAVIATESNYASNAVSPKGAVGLMQLMPSLAKQYGVTDASDAAQNIRGGVQYLRYLLNAFDGNIELALAAYNAGEQTVLKYGRRVPPFPETVDYVRQVERIYRERKQLAGEAVPEQ